MGRKLSAEERRKIHLNALQTALSYVETSIQMFENMNRNLKALTGKKSFAIDHLVYVLTIEREHIREEMWKIKKLLGET
ncbi:MAG: hypothetical protein ACTSXW_08445 [Candidatus Baldrarchaeia archaeon]